MPKYQNTYNYCGVGFVKNGKVTELQGNVRFQVNFLVFSASTKTRRIYLRQV